MTSVTRDVDPSFAVELAERGARACIALTGPDGAEVMPVKARHRDDGGWDVEPLGPGRMPAVGQEVVLLVDAGVEWYDLCAGYVRGAVVRDGGGDAFVLAPSRTLAWDYGRLRRVPDEEGPTA